MCNKKYPRLTDKIRNGLNALTEYGESFLEADGEETPDKEEMSEIEAAREWIRRGGFATAIRARSARGE